MHVLIKPVLSALAAAPLIGAALSHHVETVISSNMKSAACETRVFEAAGKPDAGLTSMIAMVDASAVYGEGANTNLFCAAKPATR